MRGVPPWVAVLALCLALWLAGALYPRAAQAQEPLTDITLVATTETGYGMLSAFTLDAELICGEEGCGLAVKQVYRLANADRAQAADVAVALRRATDVASAAVDVSFGGQATPAGPDAWTMRVNPSSSATVTLSHNLPLAGRHLLYWAWDPNAMQGWGAPQSARMTVHLPEPLPDDAYVLREPAAYVLRGSTLEWSYEAPPALAVHRVWLLSPRTWAAYEDLSARSAWSDLATLLGEMRAEALDRDVPWVDLYPRIAGARLAAVETEANAASYLALADLYLARAEDVADPNYILLAAETLETALSQGAGDAALEQRLADIYGDLGHTAREAGDPSEALRYLRLAAAHDGSGQVDAATEEELTLGWAVALAAEGHTSDALVHVAEALSPRVQDALYRYAPPVVSARTRVSLAANARTAVYDLLLYAPVQDATRARLSLLAEQLAAIPGCSVILEAGDDAVPEASLSVTLTYGSATELAARSAALAQLAAEEPDLMLALIAAPWGSSVQDYRVDRMPWADHYVYQEDPDHSLVHATRDELLQYTVWRLVEVAGESPLNEKARLEQQLTGLALRDQRQVWEDLSASTYWTYEVAFDEPSALSSLSWLLGWGQDHALQVSHRHYHWGVIAQMAGWTLLGMIVLVTLLGLFRRRRRSRSDF